MSKGQSDVIERTTLQSRRCTVLLSVALVALRLVAKYDLKQLDINLSKIRIQSQVSISFHYYTAVKYLCKSVNHKTTPAGSEGSNLHKR